MPNRFASQQDYSQTFQYLVEQNQRSLEASAQRVDAQREADWAARDALMFTRWQEGKISGGELMAHINQRMSQSFPGEEKDKWRKIALEYGNAIADERAESAYADSQDIGALIKHYAGRLGGVKKGTPEYTQLAERLRTLREKRSRDNVTNGARRIIRQIEKGQATKADLLKFYRAQSRTASGDLKQELLDNVAELRGQIREERMQSMLTEIDTLMEGSLITPQEAAKRYDEVLRKFGVPKSDPAAWATYRQQMARMNATPDDLVIAQAQDAVIKGDMSPEEYTDLINEWADKIAPYDVAAAWELRQAGDSFLQENATPLEDGLLDRAGQEAGMYSDTIGVVKKLKGNSLKYITQFDGSKYNGYNCGMAAGAMLAHSMGVGGLSGADLRALSGDTSGGTTVFQVAQALANKQVGISAGDLEARSNWGFQEFIDRLKNGSTAVLGGWTGALPGSLNSTSGAMGHSIFVAGYDPKKGFLVLDPSGKGSQQKAWWPAEVIRSFAFSGQGWQGGFNGYAVVSPPNTLKPGTLERAGGSIRYVDVTAPPSGRIPGAAPIVSATEKPPHAEAASVGEMLTDRERRRLRNAGIKPGKDLDTKQEVAILAADNEAGITALENRVQEFIKLAEAGGMDEEGRVEMLDGSIMTADDVNVLQEQLIYALDGQVILYDANGQKDESQNAKDRRGAVLMDAAVVNTMDHDRIENTAVRGAIQALEDLEVAGSATEVVELTEELVDVIEVLAAVEETEQGDLPEDATTAEKQAERVDDILTGAERTEATQWGPLFKVLAGIDEYETTEELAEALQEAAGPLLDDPDSIVGALAGEVIQRTTKQHLVDTGEGTYLVVDGTLRTVPLKESGRVDANGEPVMIADLSEFGPEMATHLVDLGINPNNLPAVVVPGPDGQPVNAVAVPTVEEYKGVRLLISKGLKGDVFETILKNGGLEKHKDWLGSGLPVNEDQLSLLSPSERRYLVENGVLDDVPFVAQKVELGGKTYWRGESIDPETGQRVFSWHEDNLPYVTFTESETDLMAPGGEYLGTDPKRPGLEWPAPVTDPELMDDSTLGTDTLVFGLTEDEAADFIKRQQEEGLRPAEQQIPDPSDPSSSITVGPDHPASPANGLPSRVGGFIEEALSSIKTAREKMASMMPPEEAAEIDFMTEHEMRMRAHELGINYDTGEWYPTGAGQEGRVDDATLKELGITLPEPEADGAAVQQDHLATVRSEAAAEKANREAKAAEKAALAEAQAAMEARTKSMLPSSSLPKVTPPTGSKSEPSLPKPRTQPKPSPTPTPTPQYKSDTKNTYYKPPAPKPKPKAEPAPERAPTRTRQPSNPEML